MVAVSFFTALRMLERLLRLAARRRAFWRMRLAADLMFGIVRLLLSVVIYYLGNLAPKHAIILINRAMSSPIGDFGGAMARGGGEPWHSTVEQGLGNHE